MGPLNWRGGAPSSVPGGIADPVLAVPCPPRYLFGAPVNLDVLAQAWRNRAAERRLHLSERNRVAREAAHRAARVLGTEFGAETVWLFGSHAWGRPHERSDIDLAATGIAADRFFSALARAAAVAPDAPLHLVRLEDCAPSLRQRILTKGVRL